MKKVKEKLNFVKKLDYVNNSTILKIENLNLLYGNKKVLNNINISIYKGEIVTILGPNGGGKTSLIKVIAGVNKKNYSGNILFAKNIKISYMPQNFKINNLMPITVEYFLLNSFSTKLKKNKSIIREIIELVGIKKILKNQVLEISAGETQLLLLARCLIVDPNLIILDEPVSAMDIRAKNRFYKIISKIVKKRMVSVIMTSHDLSCIAKCSDYIVCINNTIYCQGRLNEIKKNRNINEIFDSYTSK